MNLLISAYSCDPTRGGEFSNGWNCAFYNAKLGHKVWCITNIEGRKNIENYLHDNPIDNLHMIFIQLPLIVEKAFEINRIFGVYPHYLYWQYKAFYRVKELDKKFNFDLIHHATYGSLQLGSSLWKIGKPMIFGPVGGGQVAPKAFKKYFKSAWIQERLRSFISYILLNVIKIGSSTVKNSDCTLVVNYETYDLVNKIGSKKIQFQFDSSLSDDFYPKNMPERNHDDLLKILWVGRILPRKGLQLMLEAVSRMDGSIPFSMTIIGDGPMAKYLPTWIQELNLYNRINYIGKKPLSEVREAYKNHNLFLFGSLRETLATQLLEAMAFGLPVITLNHQGNSKFIPDDVAIKVPVTNPNETIEHLKNALHHLYFNSKERVQLGKNAFHYAKFFSATNYIKSINQVYNSVLEEKSIAK